MLQDYTEPYQNIANAIVALAAEDYRLCIRRRKRRPRNKEILCELQELEAFFHSGYFSLLTTTSPEYIITKIQAEEGYHAGD